MRLRINPKRIARSGHTSVYLSASAQTSPIGTATNALRAAAARVRDGLDAVGALGHAGGTPLEMKRASDSVFSSMSSHKATVRELVDKARQYIEGKMNVLDGVLRAIEGRESALSVARLVREADELAAMRVSDRADHFTACVAARDLVGLLRHSLVAGCGDMARSAMMNMARPAETAALRDEVPSYLQLVEAAQQFDAGMAMLSTEREPWAQSNRMDGGDLIQAGNDSGSIPDEHASPTWPSWVRPRSMSVPMPVDPLTKPEPKPMPKPAAAAEVPQEHAAGGWPASV